LGGVLRRVFLPPQIGKGGIATASSKPRNDKKRRVVMTDRVKGDYFSGIHNDGGGDSKRD